MTVCIAEKPSVAQDIAKVIGANRRCEGYFEGNGFQVTWTFGHLCRLKTPEEYDDGWKRWSLESLPMVPEQFGIHLITLTAGEMRRQFMYIKDILISRYTVTIGVRHNADKREQRTKISLTTNVTLPPGRIYYTVGDCPIPFLFPEIRAAQNEPVTQHFLIKTPADPASLRFHVQTCNVPPDAEVYPEGETVLKHNIDLICR